jgi:hypothetical protein
VITLIINTVNLIYVNDEQCSGLPSVSPTLIKGCISLIYGIEREIVRYVRYEFGRPLEEAVVAF